VATHSVADLCFSFLFGIRLGTALTSFAAIRRSLSSIAFVNLWVSHFEL